MTPLKKGWIQKDARCMGATQKPTGLNYHLQLAAKLQEKRTLGLGFCWNW